MNWLRRVWKWVVSGILVVLYVGTCWLLYSSLFGANEETKKVVDKVKIVVDDIQADVKVLKASTSAPAQTPTAIVPQSQAVPMIEAPAATPVITPAAISTTVTPTPITAADIDALIVALGSQQKTPVEKAQDRLAEISGPAIPKLIAKLYHENANIRIAAGKTLIQIGGPAVQPLMEEIAGCADEDVAHFITRVLRYIGPAIGPLRKLEGQTRLQDAAKEILREVREDKLTKRS